MVKKSLQFIGRFAVWLMTLCLFTLMLLVGRLMVAPIDVSFAKEIVLDQAVKILPGWQADFEKATIKWDWAEVGIELDVEGLFLIDRKDRLRADFKLIKLDVSSALLFTGKLNLQQFHSKDVIIRVSDLGGFSDSQQSKPLFKQAGSDVSFLTPASLKPMTEGLTRFTKRLLKQQPEVSRLSFENLHILMATGEGQAPFNLILSIVMLEHIEQSINYNAKGTTTIGDLPMGVTLKGGLNAQVGYSDTDLTISDINLVDIAQKFSLPEIMKAMDFPASMTMQLRTTTDAGLEKAEIDVNIGKGTVYHPYHFPNKGRVENGALKFSYDIVNRRLELLPSKLTLFADQSMDIDLEGMFYWQDGLSVPGIKIRAQSPQAFKNHITAFWPVLKSKVSGKPQAGRTWVENNIQHIIARDLDFQFNVSPLGKGLLEDGESLLFTFDAENVKTNFVQGMPPIEQAALKGKLTGKRLTLDVQSGVVEQLDITGSHALIDWSRQVKDHTIGRFEIASKGTVKQVLDLIALPPLKLTQKFGFDPSRIGGYVTGQTVLDIPLLKIIPSESVKVHTVATVSDAYVKDILGGEGLTKGDLKLDITNDQIFAEGTGLLNGVAIRASWLEDFKAGRDSKEGYTTRLVLSGDIDAYELAAFGLNDMQQYAQGKMPMEATFLGRTFNFTEGYFSADATPATLKLDILAWDKEIGRVANINGGLVFDEEKIELKPMTIKGDNIDVSIDVLWDRGRRFKTGSMPFDAKIIANKLDGHQLTAQIKNVTEGVLEADIRGPQLDLKNLLSGRRQSALTDEDPNSYYPQLNLSIAMDRVLLKNNVAYHSFTADILLENGDPDKMKLKAYDKKNYPLTGSILPREVMGKGASKRELNPMKLTTNNGGELLRGLGIFSHGMGGSIDFNGEIMGWTGADFNISGRFKMYDMMLVRANKLPDTVTEGVLDGINQFVDDKGLLMKKADGRFTFKDTILDISSFKANSANLGLTLAGQYEDRTRRINMNGVVVPAYGLNSFLGQIPLVGPILTGGKGKGLFGVTYRLKGQGSNAKFTVNPLSAVTPGFLRNIFEGSKGLVEDVKIDPIHDQAGQGTGKDDSGKDDTGKDKGKSQK